MSNGRGWAYAGLTIGSVVSLAGNVTDSIVHHRPFVSGTIWPTVLFVGVEIVVRTKSQRSAWKWTRALGMIPIVLVAAVVSYVHLSGLLSFWGEDMVTRTFGPVAIDGLMVVSTGALVLTAVVPELVVPVLVSEPDVPVDTADSVDTEDTILDTDTEDMILDTKPRRTRTATWDKDKAAKLISEGRSNSEIGELVGVSAKTISRYRKELEN